MAGTTIKSVRHYSDIGLVQPVSVTESGYRLYSSKEIWQLNMITTLRSLGFSLPDIAKLQEGEISVHQAIQLQLEAVRHQKNLYERMEQTLEKALQIKDSEESLSFMQNIVDVMKQSAETRQAQLIQKVRGKLDEQAVPTDWFQLLFSNIRQSIGSLENISAEQAVVWNKLKELWDSPGFAADFQQHVRSFTGERLNSKVKGDYYDQALNRILLDVMHCIESNIPYTARQMQDLVIACLRIFADMMQTEYSADFAANIYPVIQYFTSQRAKQFYSLLSEFNPASRKYQEAWDHIYDGYYWMLEQNKFGISNKGGPTCENLK